MPYKPGEREYRSINVMFDAVVPSDGEENEYIVEGYATTFDSPYDFGPDGWKECISSRALDGADMTDVIFQENHEGSPLARLRNNTLTLIRDEHGLLCRAKLWGSRKGRDLHEAIRNGLICAMSWGFSLPYGEEGYVIDRASKTSTITKIAKVFDVSAVTFPANANTEIHARSYLDGAIEAEQKEFLRRDREMRQRAALKLRLL